MAQKVILQIAMNEKRNLKVTETDTETSVPVEEGLSYDEVSIIKGMLVL